MYTIEAPTPYNTAIIVLGIDDSTGWPEDAQPPPPLPHLKVSF